MERGYRIERMEASEVIAMASMGCWMVCSMVYSTKYIGIDNPECDWFFRREWIYVCCLCVYSFLFGVWRFVHMMDDAKPDGEGSRRRECLRCDNMAIVVLILVGCFCGFVDYRPLVCPPRPGSDAVSDQWFHVEIVVAEGYLLISLFRFYKICYGLFLGLLAGLVFSSYKGFGTQDPFMYNSIVFLSVALIFLCGLHWRRSNTSVNHLNSPDAPDAPDAAVPQAHDDQIHQSLLV